MRCFAGNVIRFSVAGGIEVEENWDKVKETTVGIDQDISSVDLTNLLEGVGSERVGIVTEFIQAVYKVFVDLDFTLLEMNPFCFDESTGIPVPLDMHAELDDTALFKNRKKWQDIEFPNPFGRTETPEEHFVEELDSKTGASLKLTVLNPRGRIWTMIAGGGASVVFSDAIADAGYGSIMGNYGEYSGNPSEEETYQYAKTIIGLATRYPEDGKKSLIIGGGIANFTDVAKTFKGITHAIEELQEDLQKAQIKIFVRRGGPNYQTGLSMMRNLGHRLGLPIDVHGPEMGMTEIVPMAVHHINS
jgi:ATP citrate (pro-S)-lyase